jgi:tRNA 2-thiouridine synthesizing protein A
MRGFGAGCKPFRIADRLRSAYPDAMTETMLDLRGLKCPLPVLKTRKALAKARGGALIAVSCTDPMAAIDLPNLARETGDTYEGAENAGDFVIHRLRKKAT